MSKSKADALMAEFFAERKKERVEETQLLKSHKESGLDQASASVCGLKLLLLVYAALSYH
jgi:hypothetical protein